MFLQLFRLPALGFCLLSTAFATELAKPSYSISDSEVSNLAFGSITVRAPRSAAETDVGFWAKATVATAGGVVTSYKIAELPYTVTRDEVGRVPQVLFGSAADEVVVAKAFEIATSPAAKTATRSVLVLSAVPLLYGVWHLAHAIHLSLYGLDEPTEPKAVSVRQRTPWRWNAGDALV